MILYLVLQIQSSSKFQLQIIWAKLQLMWAKFLIEAIKVSRNRISFAFNLGQFYALSAGRVVFDCGPRQLTMDLTPTAHHMAWMWLAFLTLPSIPRKSAANI